MMVSRGATGGSPRAARRLETCVLHRITAEDIVPELGQADGLNLDWGFLRTLRDAGRTLPALERAITFKQRSEALCGRPRPLGQGSEDGHVPVVARTWARS